MNPIWDPTKSLQFTPCPAEIIYNSGLNYFSEENYVSAEASFKDLIENHTETPFALAAMHELFALQQFTNQDFASLHNYFASFTEADSTLYDKAQFLATRCNVKSKQYTPAIDWYENRIENPPSYQDSVFAVIDVGEIYLLMEQDDELELKARPISRFPELRPKTRVAFEKTKADLLATLPQKQTTKPRQPLANGNTKGALGQNIPNPATESTIIVYELFSDGFAEIKIYNILGQIVQTEKLGVKKEGVYQTEISLKNLPSGIYNYALFVNGVRVDSKKMAVQ